MANIQLSELHPAGYELLHDSESFLNELANQDMLNIVGGHYHKSHSGSYGSFSYGNSYSGHSHSGNYYSKHYGRGYWH